MEKLNYPVVEFRPRTWEIDEFDCASIFVLDAMLVSCSVTPAISLI